MNDPVRIAIVGAGNAGAKFAYLPVLGGPAGEIVLNDASGYSATCGFAGASGPC
jgi:hypothetical protein